MSSQLRVLIIVTLILVGVVACALCAEGPYDACADACCGVSDCLRPTGRVARGLGGLLSLVAATVLGLSAFVSLGRAEPTDRRSLRPLGLAVSSLRI